MSQKFRSWSACFFTADFKTWSSSNSFMTCTDSLLPLARLNSLYSAALIKPAFNMTVCGNWKFYFFYSSWKYLILVFVFRLNIFASKVLNLLLSLEAEGAWGLESFSTSEIPNDVFLMIYFSILLLFLFNHFSELQSS